MCLNFYKIICKTCPIFDEFKTVSYIINFIGLLIVYFFCKEI